MSVEEVCDTILTYTGLSTCYSSSTQVREAQEKLDQLVVPVVLLRDLAPSVKRFLEIRRLFVSNGGLSAFRYLVKAWYDRHFNYKF